MQLSLFDDQEVQPQCPFTNRSVCVLGQFSQGRALVPRLQRLGADVRLTVTRQLHYVLVGENAPSAELEKLEQMNLNGWVPRQIGQAQLDEILNGFGSSYHVEAEICKHLTLSAAHWHQFRVDFSSDANPLYTCELYVPVDDFVKQHNLYQELGNRGIYANPSLDETIDCLFLSDDAVKHMLSGTTCDELKTIERLYNESRSQMFRWRLTCVSDILDFLEK